MSTLYVNAIATFKKQFAYRIPVIVSFFGTIVSIYIQIALWSYLYRDDLDSTIYMTDYICLSNIISCFYEPRLAKDIERRFRTGDLAIDLIRPADVSFVFWGQAAGMAASKIVVRGIPIIFVLLYFFKESTKLISADKISIFLVSIVFGCIIYYSIFFTIGFLSIKTNAVWPYVRIINDTIRFISGSVIPLNLFPDIMQTLFRFLPFRMLYSFPIMILLDDLNIEYIFFEFCLIILWSIFCIWLERMIYTKLSKHISIQGG